MPVSYTLDEHRNVADVQVSGAVTLDDAVKAIRSVAAELSQHQCGSLVDAREMEYTPSIADLRDIAFEFVRLRAAFRCGIAFVVSNDKHYGLGRLLATMVDSSGLRIGVFLEHDDAEEWLRNLVDVHLNGS